MGEIRRERTEPLTNFVVADLDEEMRALVIELGKLEGGRALLRLLYSRKNSVLTAEDLAYHLAQSQPVVEQNLRKLVELGWARRVEVMDWSWYGLTADPQQREIVQALTAWEELWKKRLDEFQRMIDGVVIQSMVLP